METKQSLSASATRQLLKPAVSLTFSPKVTRDQLIANLDRILGEIGCTACGLNGIDFIKLKSDPFPELIHLRQAAFQNKLDGVIQFDVDIQQNLHI